MADIPITNPPTNHGKPVDFLSVVSRYGSISRANRFVTRITPRGSVLQLFQGSNEIFRDMEFLCESSQLPGRTLQTSDVRYYGPVQKFPNQTVYADLDLVFICRNEMHEKDLFDSWMQLINPIASYDFRYRSDYVSTIEVFQFSDVGDANGKHKCTYQVSFENAYPININPLNLAYADDSFHRLSVTFAYDRWYRLGEIPGQQ